LRRSADRYHSHGDRIPGGQSSSSDLPRETLKLFKCKLIYRFNEILEYRYFKTGKSGLEVNIDKLPLVLKFKHSNVDLLLFK